MYILGLFSWAASEIWGKVREVFFMLDMVPYFLIDNVYNLGHFEKLNFFNVFP